MSLELSNYAVLRASDDWDSDEAMVRLGGKDPANNIRQNGSNYYLSGGIIDGNHKADGISIDGGRETVVRNCSVKGMGGWNAASEANLFLDAAQPGGRGVITFSKPL